MNKKADLLIERIINKLSRLDEDIINNINSDNLKEKTVDRLRESLNFKDLTDE